MAITNLGRVSWGGERDQEGHRTYNLVTRVQVSAHTEGPASILASPEIPQVGDPWTFGTDFDLWAFCLPTTQVSLYSHKDGEKHFFWDVKQTFSTKPLRRCQDTKIEDPLLEPDKISGSFIKYTKESSEDRNGLTVRSSSHEIFKGPEVEWDANRQSVRIVQNRADLELALLAQLMDNLNDDTLWGLTSRKVKFSECTWEEKWYGTCNKYYTRSLGFDIDFTTFDRDIPDQGSKVLRGDWQRTGGKVDNPPVWVPDAGTDKDNPQHFQQFKDAKDENSTTLLDGSGNPLTVSTSGSGSGTSEAVKIPFEKYTEDNLLQLGIPVTLV